MKIAVLGTRGFPDVQGGIEKHCEKLYPLIANLGCKVTVFARTPYIQKEKRRKEWNKVQFIYLCCPRLKFLEAITHTFLGILKAKFISADILHIHAIGPSLLVPFAKILGLRVLVTHHGFDYQRKKWPRPAKWILQLGEFLGIKFADQVITVSKYIKNTLQQKYKQKDLVFIPNGIDMPESLPPDKTLQKYGLQTKKYVFVVSRFVPEKGLHDLIEAYKRIDNPEFKLVVAGAADHQTSYSRQLKKQAEEANVILSGFISGKPLQELYSNAGLFVLPSYHEGLPIVLLEALSYGLPVLASDILQNKEISLPACRYFPVGNIAVLSKKMQKLFNCRISAEEQTKQKTFLNQNYNWSKIAQQTFKIYKKIETTAVSKN